MHYFLCLKGGPHDLIKSTLSNDWPWTYTVLGFEDDTNRSIAKFPTIQLGKGFLPLHYILDVLFPEKIFSSILLYVTDALMI